MLAGGGGGKGCDDGAGAVLCAGTCCKDAAGGAGASAPASAATGLASTCVLEAGSALNCCGCDSAGALLLSIRSAVLPSAECAVGVGSLNTCAGAPDGAGSTGTLLSCIERVACRNRIAAPVIAPTSALRQHASHRAPFYRSAMNAIQWPTRLVWHRRRWAQCPMQGSGSRRSCRVYQASPFQQSMRLVCQVEKVQTALYCYIAAV